MFAGANGSGKSTVHQKLTIEAPRGSVWIINPDELTLRIANLERLSISQANLQSVQRIEEWLYSSLDAYQTVGVETVLSTGKYRKLVSYAKSRRFRFRLTYVYLKSAELNVERVAIRVAKGGHDVPTDKIIERRRRSFEQLKWFFHEADEAFIFDNSGAAPVLTAQKLQRKISIHGELIPEIANAIRAK